VPQTVERSTRTLRVFGATHRLDDVESADRNRGQRGFRAAGDDDVDEIVADVAERFANGNCAAGATVRIGRAHAAKPKIDSDVGMGRTTEHLHGESRLNTARAFLQKPDVLLFRLAHTAERGAEADANAVLRSFTRIFDAGVVQSQLG